MKLANNKKKRKLITKAQLHRLIKIELGFVTVVLVILSILFFHNYAERPGLLNRNSIIATSRGTDFITLEWKETRNTEFYSISYVEKGTFSKSDEAVTVNTNSATITGLKQGTKYTFVIMPVNSKQRGWSTVGKSFSTRQEQSISVRNTMTLLTSSNPVQIDANAETAITFKSSNDSIAEVASETGIVTPKSAGNVIIQLSAIETDEYLSSSAEVILTVIEASPVNASGASAHIIYTLNSDNCEIVKSITGSGSAIVPQSLAYTGDEYIVAYGMDSSQRIISFDVDGNNRSVSTPTVAIGHPNGFTYADSTGLCYCVKGWTGRCVTYSPETGDYNVITLPYGVSGIAYDRALNMFYTSSRTAMVSYTGDGKFSVSKRIGVVNHSMNTDTQDCGGHAGILMRCLSPSSSKHGTNYIDLYDMVNGEYLGTIACNLSEVESAIVDTDGYMQILSNTSGSTDYIWKTPINIEDIGAGL